MTEYYGFTIKCIKHGYDSQVYELENIMQRMLACHKAIYVEHYYETDSIKRLHVHGTFMARKGILRSKFKQQYWHIHIDLLPTIEDVHNWSRYITKDQDQPIEDLISRRDKGEYLFI